MISMSSSSSPTNNNNNNTAAAATSNSRLVYGRDDALFGAIEKQHGAVPFGSVLDAGTGLHSLRWLATLLTEKGMTDFVAVTADAIMQRNCQREIEALLGGGEPDASKKGTILCGNWFPSDTTTTTPTTITSTSTSESVDDDNGHNDTLAEIVEDSENDEVATKWNGGNNAGGNTAATFVNDIRLQLKDRQFDVILVDYLIGAMDGFSPHQQDLMLPTLARYLKPGGRMYIVGLEPIPDDEGLLGKVRRVRDACILLAGHKCYREYPVAWIHRQIDALSSPINDDNNERNENESPNRTNNHVDNNQDWNANNSNESSTPPPPQSVSLVRRHTKQFPILYRHATIVKQINVGRSKLAHMSSEALRLAMGQVLDDLEAESLLATSQSPTGRIQCGFDYVVTAERVR